MNNGSNNDVAKNFRKDVDQMNYSYLAMLGAGIGSPVIKTIVKVFNKKDRENLKTGDVATLFKLLGFGLITGGPAAIFVSLMTYLQAESTIRINFDMCLFD